jgi:hypothetical protein
MAIDCLLNAELSYHSAMTLKLNNELSAALDSNGDESLEVVNYTLKSTESVGRYKLKWFNRLAPRIRDQSLVELCFV